jgi:hypothetical protein
VTRPGHARQRWAQPALCLAVTLALIMMSAPTQAQPSPRRAAGEAARYLGLTAAQQAQIDSTVQAWKTELQTLQASDGPKLATAQRAALCQRSRQRLAQHIDQARAVLTPEQQTRLAMLEQAMQLLTTVESAQAALLLPERMSAAPAGLPAGHIDSDIVFRRMPAPALPGCPALTQQVRPEVEGPAASGSAAKPAK